MIYFQVDVFSSKPLSGNGFTVDCAYLVKNGFKKTNELIHVFQGQFVNRPSIIKGWLSDENLPKKSILKVMYRSLDLEK